MDYLKTVEDAVNKFYSMGSKEAHMWLLQFQSSPEAWAHVWPLLDPSKPGEVQFFAATTLHSKISKHLHEVPRSDYPDLKNRLINIIKSPTTPKLILTRLCQGIAAFVINSDTAEENDGIIDDLIKILPCDSMVNVELLLRVLTALPTELDKRSGSKKTKLRDNLVETWCKAAWVLQRVFDSCRLAPSESEDEGLYRLALECCLVWLKLTQLPIDTISHLYPDFLLAADRYAPSPDENTTDDTRAWEITQDCLMTTLNHSELTKRPQLLWQWSKDLIIVAQRKNSICFSEVLSSLGENHSRFILLAFANDSDSSQRWTAENLIKILLDCVECPGRYPIDEQRSTVPFGFWYSLQDDLSTFDPPVENQIKNALKPIYARLAQALLVKTKLPITNEEIGDPDERELFRCYRQDAADTLAYCYNVLGQDLFLIIGQRLSQPQLQNQTWTDVESTLHAFQSLSDCIGTQEIEFVPAIMDLIFTLPYNHYPKEVMACACSTIGSYAEWIGENPNPWLERSLQLVTMALTCGQITATPASMALKDISRECGQHLGPLAPTILETISKTLTILSAGSGEGLRLMYAAGKLLNSLPSMDDQLKYLDKTLGPCIVKLHQLLQQHSVNTARAAVNSQLKMATMFLSTLDGAMGRSVLDALLPIFNEIVGHPEWSQDDTVLESMLLCAQQTLQCLLHPETEAKPLLPILVVSYKTRPHPAALSLLRHVVLLFGRDSDNVMGPVFADISAHSLRGFSNCQSVGGNLSELADLLEAFLGLLAQICKKSPKLMVQVADQIPEMLKCGIAGLGLPESSVIKASGTFLTNAIGQTTQFSSYIQMIGQELVCKILQCVEGGVPRGDLEAHAKVLLALNNNCGGWTGQWLRVALENSTITTPGQKDDFARNVLRERMNSRRLFETLQKHNTQCHRQIVGI